MMPLHVHRQGVDGAIVAQLDALTRDTGMFDDLERELLLELDEDSPMRHHTRPPGRPRTRKPGVR